MGRAGRRGDASYWLRNRRSFNDSIDAQCRAACKERTVELFEIQCLLQNILMKGHHIRPKVMQVERIGQDKIEVSISREGNTKGCDVILLKIVED